MVAIDLNGVQAMVIKRVETKKISEVIRDELEMMIRNGELQPGEKLQSVEKLAKEFNVSRSAVREALSALRAIGYITIKQGEGTYVNKFDVSQMMAPVSPERIMSKKEIEELLQIRKIMEVGAASLAATHRTDEDLAEMRAALTDMAQSEGDLGEKADVRFHLALAKSTNNGMLHDMMQQLSDTLGKTMYETRRIALYSTKQTLERLQDEHERIYEAIEARDAEGANDAMLQHLMNVEQTLMEVYEKQL